MPRDEQLLKEVLRRKSSRIRFASIFGSYGREEAGRFSDVDIFVVCEEEADKAAISNDLLRLGSKIKRDIDVNIFASRAFEHRIRNHDYLTASVLDDCRFILGDEDTFLQQKKRILRGTPNIESVEYNRKMGLRLLNHTAEALKRSFPNPSFAICEATNVRSSILLKCLRDYHLGLGYLFASAKMNQLSKAMTLGQLLASDDAFFLRNLILKEKEVIHGATINLKDMWNLLDYSKRVLTYKSVL